MSLVIEPTVQDNHRNISRVYWVCADPLFEPCASLILGEKSGQSVTQHTNTIQTNVGTTEIFLVRLVDTLDGNCSLQSEIQGILSDPDQVSGIVVSGLIQGISGPEFKLGDLIISPPTSISSEDAAPGAAVTPSKLERAVETLRKNASSDEDLHLHQVILSESFSPAAVHHMNHCYSANNEKNNFEGSLVNHEQHKGFPKILESCSKLLKSFQTLFPAGNPTYLNLCNPIVVFGVSEHYNRNSILEPLTTSNIVTYITEVINTMDNTQKIPIEKLRNTEAVVPPPQETPKLPPFPKHDFPSYGDNVLLVVPTANDFKRQVLESKFEGDLPSWRALHTIIVPGKSNVGEQPYNDAGLRGAYNRITHALTLLESDEYKEEMKKLKIGTVFVGSIENYIRTKGVEKPTDHAAIVLYNATKDKTEIKISQGVTISKDFVDEARSYGLDGDDDYGKKTVGDVVAESTTGVNNANWHIVLAGKSRYDIIKETMTNIEIMW